MLVFNNVNNIEGEKITIKYDDKLIELDFEDNQESLRLELNGESEVEIEVSKVFTPNNGDERELSVLMSIEY
jgi:hypothetical protein